MSTVKQVGLLIQWQLRRGLELLPLMVIVQALLSVASIVGFSYLAGGVTSDIALYLATGAPTITLITVGLVMTPQQVGEGKKEGSLDWLHTLPVPRWSFLVADLVLWTVIALPGLVLSIVVGSWYYNLSLAPAPWLALAVLAVSLTAASIGYAIATALPPMVAMLISQLLVFVILYFTPIAFPATRMPSWLQTAHHWLPFEPMAQVIRAGLAPTTFTVSLQAVLVLALWCLVSVGGSALILGRRR